MSSSARELDQRRPDAKSLRARQRPPEREERAATDDHGAEWMGVRSEGMSVVDERMASKWDRRNLQAPTFKIVKDEALALSSPRSSKSVHLDATGRLES